MNKRFFRYEHEFMREPEYNGPRENPFKVGQWVKFRPPQGTYDVEPLRKWKEELGPGPYEVVAAPNADEYRDVDGKIHHTDDLSIPMVYIQPNKLGAKIDARGYGWFKRVLKRGDICPHCGGEFRERALFSSLYLGCLCPEEKD